MPPTSAERKQQVVADFRRSEILAAATKVFANKGFDATRMEEIAKGAKLAKGTLYRYFDSKDAVYIATVQQAVSTLATLTEEHVNKERSFAGKLAAFVSIRIAFWNEHQQLYRIILTIRYQGQHRKRSYTWQREVVLYLRSLFEDAVRAGEIPQQDCLAAAWATMDVIRGVSERRAFPEERSTQDEAKFLTDFLLRGLGARQ